MTTDVIDLAELSATLSRLTIDEVATVLVKATVPVDWPVAQTCISLANLISTIASISPAPDLAFISERITELSGDLRQLHRQRSRAN